MAVFPSESWCRAVVEAANADPEAAAAAQGWKGDLALVVEAEPGRPAFAAWARPAGGCIEAWRVVEVGELESLAPAYLARAPYRTWRGLLEGTIDPIEAVLFKGLGVSGDAEQLVARLRFKGFAARVLAAVETRFE